MHFYTIELSLKVSDIMGCNPEKQQSRLQLCWFFIISAVVYFDTYLKLMLFFEIESVADFVKKFYSIPVDLYGIVLTSFFYSNRNNMLSLIEEIDKKFWIYENHEISDDDKRYFEIKSRNNKIIGVSLVLLTFITAFLFFFPPFVSDTDLPFDSYRPSWLSFKENLLVQTMVAIFAELPALTASMLLMSTFCLLTQLQFHLVNLEIVRILKIDERLTYKDVSHIIRHHIFLLRFVRDINKTFSAFIFGYLCIFTLSICLFTYSLTAVSTTIDSTLQLSFGIILQVCHFMIFFVYPSQDLSDEIQQMGNSVYLGDWEKHPELRHFFLMVIQNCQTRIELRVPGLINVNLNSSVQIMNAVFSYLAFLNAVTL